MPDHRVSSPEAREWGGDRFSSFSVPSPLVSSLPTSSLTPSPLPTPSCLGPTYVALRHGGQLQHAYWRYELDLNQLLVAIVEDAIARVSNSPTIERIDAIELCFTHNYLCIEPAQFPTTFANIHRGIRGIELQYQTHIVRYSPTRMIASNLSFQKIWERFLAQESISEQKFKRNGGVIQAFDARQVLVTLTPDVTAQTLHRGNRVVPLEKLSGELLADLTTNMGQWLLRQVRADGRMVYKYMPSRGKESTANNLIRQFMATLALIRYAQSTQDDAHWTLAEQNLAYNLTEFYTTEAALGWVEYDGKAKLGAIALAALAILEYSDHVMESSEEVEGGASDQALEWAIAPVYRQHFDQLCATIKALWQMDGSFRTFLRPSDRNDNQNFYPGEALLFWAALYRRTRDPDLLHRFYTSFNYYRTWHRTHYNPAFIPWHTQAYALLYETTEYETTKDKTTEDEAVGAPTINHETTDDSLISQDNRRQLLDFIFEMNDGLLSMQQWSASPDTLHTDVQGRFYAPNRNYGPPHASSTGVYLEGLADAYRLAVQVGDIDRAQAYEVAIWRGLRSVRQLQFRDAVDWFYVSNRDAVQGGLRTTVYDNVIRVDNVQHCLMALLKLQSLPAFQAQAAPPLAALTAANLPTHDAPDLKRPRFSTFYGEELEDQDASKRPPLDALSIQTSATSDTLQQFRLIDSCVDIQPLLMEIAAHTDLWLKNTSRQDNINVQRETQTIFLRSATKPFPPGITSSNDVHASTRTRVADHFPLLLGWAEQFAAVQQRELGRVSLVRLAPKSRVYRHIDHGEYYRVRDRYHLVLHSPVGSILGAGEEWVRMQAGECWWFNNKEPHEAYNESDDWRIHLIFDVSHEEVSHKEALHKEILNDAC